MTYDEENQTQHWMSYNPSVTDAYRGLCLAQSERDKALRQFVEAERRLYDAQEELKAAHLLRNAIN